MTFEDLMAARAPTDHLDFFLSHIGVDTHLLDAGCGDGAMTVGLAALCGRVTALDLSAEDFGVAMAASARHGLTNLSFVQGDATRLPFPDQAFDAVLAHSVLESGVEPAAVLGEALRVLRPGGWSVWRPWTTAASSCPSPEPTCFTGPTTFASGCGCDQEPTRS